MEEARRGRRKKKQRDKTAARDYDPYFGDLTKVAPAKPVSKADLATHQCYAAQLQEIFPFTDRKAIELMLTENNNNFDLTVEAIIKLNSERQKAVPVRTVPGEYDTETEKSHDEAKSAAAPEKKEEPQPKVPESEPEPTEQKKEPEEEKKKPDSHPAKEKEDEVPSGEGAAGKTVADTLEEEEEAQSAEYQKGIDERVAKLAADNFVNKYPRLATSRRLTPT